jgi:hypothetical protein
MDAASFACSSGSACKSCQPEPSEVLLACGLEWECAGGSLRVTLGAPMTAGGACKMKHVVVTMSGGVDSSVTTALSWEQGYDVVGMMLRLLLESGVELVDMEGLYIPARRAGCPAERLLGLRPPHRPQGSVVATADRFAGDVLLTEMLGLGDETVRGSCCGKTCCFGPAEMPAQGGPNPPRYRALIVALTRHYGILSPACSSALGRVKPWPAARPSASGWWPCRSTM